MKRATVSDYLLLGLILGILISFVLYPLILTLGESFKSTGGFVIERYTSFFDLGSSNFEALVNSVLISILSVVLSGLFGVGLAYLVSEFDFPAKAVLKRIAVLPIALPPLVGVVAFLFLYGESGILPRALKELLGLSRPVLFVEGFSAVLLVHTYSFYVYFYLFCSAMFARMDPSVIEAAINLGSSRWRTIRRIILPLLIPAIVGASLLTFMASMASFSAPFLFAGEMRFMTLQIYNAKLNGDMALAATHSVVLVAIAILFLIFLRRYSSGRLYAQASRGVARTHATRISKGGRVFATIGGFLSTIFILLPVLTIVLVSFAEEGSWTWQLLPTSYTLKNYTDLFTVDRVFEPVFNSGLMSILATTANVLFGVTIAFLVTRKIFSPRTLGSGAEVISILPFAVPGTVIALSLIIAFNSPRWFIGDNILVGTFWILPLAYFVRHLPLVVRSVSAGFSQLDKTLEEAAFNLGAGQVRTFRRIILPSILPSIVAGGLLALIAALGEFVSSILLYTYDSRPISVEILSQLRLYNFGGAATYGVLLLVLVMLATYVANFLSGDRARRDVIVY